MLRILALSAILLAFVAVARGPKSHELEGYTFSKYMQDFKKQYSTVEELAAREAIFNQRLETIKKHNANPHASWKKGVNHMSDWTEVERKALNGLKYNSANLATTKPLRTHLASGRALPPSVDYRRASPPILSAVKDQGNCGSCWAHSATETIESYWAMATNELFTLSQEQITACTPNPNQCGGSGGCGGNIYELGWDYVVGAGGVAQEWTYPYESYFGTTGTCYTFPIPNSTRKFMPVATITGYVHVQKNSAEAVMDALANVGPLSISLDASEWFEYEGGIFTGCDFAKNITIDHGVQLVGYGTDMGLGMDYWIVRNSWSPAWGEDGFIRLQRHSHSYCGWNKENDSQGIGCRGTPNTTYVCGMCGLAVDAAYVEVSP